MLCTTHTATNARPFEGMDVIVFLPLVTYITIYISEKPTSARSATTHAVQSSSEIVTERCLVVLRQCPNG